jgi:hypothetical protein
VNLVQNGSFSSTTLKASGFVSGNNLTDWTDTSGYTILYTASKSHTTDTWHVGLGNSYQNAPTQSVDNHGLDNWMQVTLDFVATATSEVLSFTASGTPGQSEPPFALLDGVSVVQQAPNVSGAQPVPEPPAYAAMLVALLGMLGTRRLWARRA